MKSPRGLAASLVLLLAIPIAALYRALFGSGAETVVHLALAAGSLLMAFAVFDFKTAKWISWIGCASAGLLAAIFLLQAASEVSGSERLGHLAYQVLGQRLEGWLFDAFVLWCIAVLFLHSRGKLKALGLLAVSAVICLEAFLFAMSRRGIELSATVPNLKVLSLLLFVWLLFESSKPLEQEKLGLR